MAQAFSLCGSPTPGSSGNIFEHICEIAAGKTVAVIGRFPSNNRVTQVARTAYLLELDPDEGELPPTPGSWRTAGNPAETAGGGRVGEQEAILEILADKELSDVVLRRKRG